MREQLQAAAVALAELDHDWAEDDNGVGFSKATTTFGHAIADLPVEHWDETITRAAWETLRWHKVQLSSLGIDFDEIEEPAGEAPSHRKVDLVDHSKLETKVHLVVNGNGLAFRSVRKPRQSTLDLIKTAPGRAWNRDGKYWNVPPSSALREIVTSSDDFVVGDEVLELLHDAPVVEHKSGTVVELGDRGFVFHGYSWGGHNLLNDIKAISGRKWLGKENSESRWVVPFEAAGEVEQIVARYDHVTLDEACQVELEKYRGEMERRFELSSATDADFEVEGVNGQLLPFQRAGVKLAASAKRFLIADEMGLGKTVQGIATLQKLEAFPAVIVVPASLKYNWRDEFEKFLPQVSTQVVNGRKPVELGAEVIIVNYDILKWHVTALRALEPKAVIFDEIHKLKSQKAQRTKASSALAAGVEVIGGLTGTPVINTPVDLISQLKVIDRLNDLGGWKGFTDRYCVACPWGGFEREGRDTDVLNDEMRKRFYVRRLKGDVLKELPAKRWATVPVTMTNPAAYRRAEKDDSKEVIAKLAKLRRLVAESKLKASIEWIDDFLESGQKLVVFGHHREVTTSIAEHFGAPCIIGGVSAEARNEAVQRFQNDPECKIIVGNLSAMGEGLTLTAASNVVFLEQAWTPALMDQAIDRCHRIGQSDSVTGWKLVVKDTVDEDIDALVEAKRDIVGEATDGASDNEFITTRIQGRLA